LGKGREKPWEKLGKRLGEALGKALEKPLEKPWEKPWEKLAWAVALWPPPRHCRRHESRNTRLGRTSTSPSMILSRQGDSRLANRESCS
jgi:hypothetical protein